MMSNIPAIIRLGLLGCRRLVVMVLAVMRDHLPFPTGEFSLLLAHFLRILVILQVGHLGRAHRAIADTERMSTR